MFENKPYKGSFAAGKDGLTIDGVSAVVLAETYGTPLFVYSETRLEQNVERLLRAGERLPVPLKVCYAAKAMSTMGILESVREAGSDLEVNSGGELWKALKAGFRGDQIVYNGTSKERWELEMAIDAGIYAIQADSPYEVSLIESVGKERKKRANVSLRLVPEIQTGTHSGLQTALLSSKFGMMPDEAFKLFAHYKDSEFVDLCGIHLHIGSQNPDLQVYIDAFEKLYVCLSCIYGDTGIRLRHVNLGGGFPVNYLEGGEPEGGLPEYERTMLAAEMDPGDALAAAWDSAMKITQLAGNADLLEGVEILIEPGRSVVADAGICLTTVHNSKVRPVPSGGEAATDTWLMTDAGFNILLSMETYKWYYELVSATRPTAEHDVAYRVAGPLCDGGDVYFDIEGQGRLPDHRMLPVGVAPGELLALMNCGAYSLAQASQYNGRPLPAVVMIGINGKPKLLRRRDKLEDLITNDIY
jgi:diaminopimelate decarboxylase